MTTIFITKDDNWAERYDVETRSMNFNLSSEKMEHFVRGLQGTLSDLNQKLMEGIPFEVIKSVSVSIPNGRGNYGTFKPSYVPHYYHQDSRIFWTFFMVANQFASWNMFGYLLSRGMISKQDLTKDHYDEYTLIIR